MVPEEFSRKVERIADREIAIITYRLGDTYHCKAQSCPPEAEACIARASGVEREAAEKQVIAEAESLLAGG